MPHPKSVDPAQPVPAFSEHDHGNCRGDALARAEAIVDAAGGRLTPVRRRALEILLSEHRAFGAYEVLDRLTEDGAARQPPVAYRALDFLVEMGLAHRIRRLNAFAACSHPGEVHAPLFLICETCKAVAETPAPKVREALEDVAARAGFTVARANVEAVGQCPACAAA
ncbi:Fur family transcriptional regulator [Frigidibacter sp. ROC022]|uniref:Fur family transcriptional regulator n=1 Tax=Frigidibacter sp. ROC022 TaxID=2971796 RepID=UPI00215ADB3D|nr:transcriptional repressor [Frigidibacter sp. ROC022]MCR8726700.1 transcriptional repressor [Frigidibacter sp. ROC022]